MTSSSKDSASTEPSTSNRKEATSDEKEASSNGSGTRNPNGRDPESMPRAEEICSTITIDSQAVLLPLIGEKNAHLKLIGKNLSIDASVSGNEIILKGIDADVDLARDLIAQLAELLKDGESIFKGDIEHALRLLAKNRKAKLRDLFRDQIVLSGRKTKIAPKTFNQKLYLDAIRRQDLVFGIGPAGTGKTYLAMAMAVSSLLNKDVRRIVLCRPAVEAGEKLGFLPGDMAEKVNPYLRPLYDALHDMVDFQKANELIERGTIEVAPLAFMRGRTLSNAFVILDEAQNTTRAQMKMLLTRLGFGTKCVVTGDLSQVDLPRGDQSGLQQAINILGPLKQIEVLKFDDQDVVRHPLVSAIVRAYDKEGSKQDK